jgi:hypothetical protein
LIAWHAACAPELRWAASPRRSAAEAPSQTSLSRGRRRPEGGVISSRGTLAPFRAQGWCPRSGPPPRRYPCPHRRQPCSRGSCPSCTSSSMPHSTLSLKQSCDTSGARPPRAWTTGTALPPDATIRRTLGHGLRLPRHRRTHRCCSDRDAPGQCDITASGGVRLCLGPGAAAR